jgi:hypothetical protein
MLPEPALRVKLEELSEFPIVTDAGDPAAPSKEKIVFPKNVLY